MIGDESRPKTAEVQCFKVYSPKLFLLILVLDLTASDICRRVSNLQDSQSLRTDFFQSATNCKRTFCNKLKETN